MKESDLKILREEYEPIRKLVNRLYELENTPVMIEYWKICEELQYLPGDNLGDTSDILRYAYHIKEKTNNIYLLLKHDGEDKLADVYKKYIYLETHEVIIAATKDMKDIENINYYKKADCLAKEFEEKHTVLEVENIYNARRDYLETAVDTSEDEAVSYMLKKYPRIR